MKNKAPKKTNIPNPERVPIDDLFASVVSMLTSRAQEKNVNLTTQVVDAGLYVVGDALRLRHAWASGWSVWEITV